MKATRPRARGVIEVAEPGIGDWFWLASTRSRSGLVRVLSTVVSALATGGYAATGYLDTVFVETPATYIH